MATKEKLKEVEAQRDELMQHNEALNSNLGEAQQKTRKLEAQLKKLLEQEAQREADEARRQAEEAKRKTEEAERQADLEARLQAFEAREAERREAEQQLEKSRLEARQLQAQREEEQRLAEEAAEKNRQARLQTQSTAQSSNLAITNGDVSILSAKISEPTVQPVFAHKQQPAVSEPKPEVRPRSGAVVTLPTFVPDDVVLWFVSLDRSFELAGIDTEHEKYTHLTSKQDARWSREVRNIVVNEPPHQPYTTLKNAIISQFSQSEFERARELMSGLQIGEESPSRFLAKLREKAGHPPLPENHMRSLWFQRLTPSQQFAVQVFASGAPLDDQAKTADNVWEFERTQQPGTFSITDPAPASVHAISKREDDEHITAKSFAQLEDRMQKNMQDMQKAFTENMQMMAESQKNMLEFMQNSAQGPQHRGRSQFRGRSQYNNNRSKSRKREQSVPPGVKLCYYHYRFGDQARNCKEGCSFKTTTDSTNSNGSP